MKQTLSAVLVVVALSLTGACGGGGTDRPSKADVKKAITSKDSVFGTAIPPTAADCIAGVLVDSKLSDKTLEAIVKNDKKYDGSADDKKALDGLETEFGKCVTG